MAAKGSHSHSTTPPGWADVVLGYVCFLLVSEGVFHALDAIKPGLCTPEALWEIRLSGTLFFIIWALLGKLIFEPFVASAIKREEATTGAKKRAQKLKEETAKLDEELQAGLREARLAGIAKRDAHLEQAKKKAESMLEESSAKNAKQLESAQAQLAALQSSAQAELARDTDSLSKLVVEQVLGRQSSVH